MANLSKKTGKRKVGYFAFVLLNHVQEEQLGSRHKKLNKVSKWMKVGTLMYSKNEALEDARKHFGSNAKIKVEAVRVDVRPLHLKKTSNGVEVVYEEYKPTLGQLSYSCESSRRGKL